LVSGNSRLVQPPSPDASRAVQDEIDRIVDGVLEVLASVLLR
jgi:hypothetical protein